MPLLGELKLSKQLGHFAFFDLLLSGYLLAAADVLLLTPQTNNPVEIAKQVEAAGAYAVNMSARFSGIVIDIETASPVPFGAMGGYGGPYLIGYGLVRFIIEFFREPDDHLGFVIFSFSMGQVLCAFMIVAGGLLYFYLWRNRCQ